MDESKNTSFSLKCKVGHFLNGAEEGPNITFTYYISHLILCETKIKFPNIVHLIEHIEKIIKCIEKHKDLKISHLQIHIKWKNNIMEYGFNDGKGNVCIQLDKPSQNQFIGELKNVIYNLKILI